MLIMGLDLVGLVVVMQVLVLVCEFYVGCMLLIGEDMFLYVIGMVVIVVGLEVDVDMCIVVLLFVIGDIFKELKEVLGEKFGYVVVDLVLGLYWFKGFKLGVWYGQVLLVEIWEQIEVLCKMLLVMVDDVCVVLMCFVSCIQFLCYFIEFKGVELFDCEVLVCEVLELYVLFVNCFGVWQLKWELEDLFFCFFELVIYKCIVKMLDECCLECVSFIDNVVGLFKCKFIE